jgi:hypothetical protein
MKTTQQRRQLVRWQAVAKRDEAALPIHPAHEARVHLGIDPRLEQAARCEQHDEVSAATKAGIDLLPQAVSGTDLPLVEEGLYALRFEVSGNLPGERLILCGMAEKSARAAGSAAGGAGPSISMVTGSASLPSFWPRPSRSLAKATSWGEPLISNERLSRLRPRTATTGNSPVSGSRTPASVPRTSFSIASSSACSMTSRRLCELIGRPLISNVTFIARVIFRKHHRCRR